MLFSPAEGPVEARGTCLDRNGRGRRHTDGRSKKVSGILRPFTRGTRTVSNRKLVTFDPPPLQWVFSFNFEICVWRPDAAGAVE